MTPSARERYIAIPSQPDSFVNRKPPGSRQLLIAFMIDVLRVLFLILIAQPGAAAGRLHIAHDGPS
jgi:hypothetical protein